MDPVKFACECAERMMVEQAPVHEILTCLVNAAETVSGPRSVVSVLVLDENGLLRNGASPKLPRHYLEAIDGLKPDPGIGTCAAAAATGRMVMTPSFLADGKWAELRHLPLSIGFVGAWSMPITCGVGGNVLGTFGTYYRDVREPTALEIETVRTLASVAGYALSHAPGKV